MTLMTSVLLYILSFTASIYFLGIKQDFSVKIIYSLLSIQGLVLLGFFYYIFVRRRFKNKNLTDIGQIKERVCNLSGVTDQISNSSENLNQGSLEQAEALEQTATATQEIASMAKNNSQVTELSRALIDKCLDSVLSGENSMGALMQSFNEILKGNIEFERFIKDNNEQLNEIKNVIAEISEKTSVINDIVFQTKLLAFNASVEAARAGEHGNGFAVVAEEVGSLASMSGKASNEISSILQTGLERVEKIINETSSKVENLIILATRRIENGEKQASLNIENFKNIRGQVKDVHSNITQIAQSSVEQSSGIEEVNKAINMLEQNNQRTMLIAKQSLEVSNSLKDEFIVLNTIFKDKYKMDTVFTEFEWSDKFEIGVQEMDEEHKFLINKINIFVRALNGDGNPEKSFQDMKAFTIKHFEDEERYMKSFNYSSFEAHKKIHIALLAKVQSFENELKNGTIDKTRVVAFLKNWLVSHILGVDTQYAKESQNIKYISA